MASGHVNRIKRPNTWLHRPMLQNVKKALANTEPSTHGGGLNRSTQNFILEGKDGVWRWIRDFVEGLQRPRRRSYGIAGSAGSRSRRSGGRLASPSSSIYFQVSPHGGIRPAPRRRSRLALTLSEREEISRGIAIHRSARSMAGLLGRSPSTVSREISRNGGYDGSLQAAMRALRSQ